MDPVKIIFFDIDGTLLDPQTGVISPKTKQALQQLHENKIKLCVVTGRPPASLPDLGDLPFDVIATFNGCFCRAGDEVIYSNPIDRADIRTVLENAAALGRPVSIADRQRLAANGIDRDLGDYYRVAGLELTVAEDFCQVCKEDIYQIMLGAREEEHARILRGTENVKIAVSWERAVDVIPRTGGKGSAIRQILRYYDLDAKEAAAFGDSYNDTEMLQAVGLGVAMGNAKAGLKEMADRVCAPVSQDGIYYFCKEQGWI